MTFFRLMSAATCVVLGTGCADSGGSALELPIPYADPKPASKAQVDAPESPSRAADGVLQTGPFERKFDGVTFLAPKGWQEVSLAPGQAGFVDGRFVIPTNDGQVEITCLSSAGGVDANFSRWVGQFQFTDGERQKELKVKAGDVDARRIDLRGTFNASSSGKPGPHENWRMIGVAIPLGERDFYLKLNGPAKAVTSIETQFDDFIKGARIDR